LGVWIKRINFAFVIELGRHIEILLLSNDCVMVPGLGGFVAHHVEACYSEAEKTFFPPLRTAGFNPRLNMNDSLLVHSYTEAYDLSYPEAERRIRGEVAELKRTIEDKGSYDITNIGVLSMGDNGAYDFTPCCAGILTPRFYGLCPFEIEECERKDGVAAISVATAPVAVENAVADAVASAEGDGGPAGRTISIRVSAIRNTVALVIAIAAFFLISTPLGHDGRTGLKMGKIENGVIYRLMPKDITLGDIKIDSICKKVTAAETEKGDTAAPEEAGKAADVRQDAPDSYFCIVFASRITKKNAEAFAAQLRDGGLDNVAVLGRTGNLKVVSGRYDSERAARERLNMLKHNDRYSDCWIYRVRN